MLMPFGTLKGLVLAPEWSFSVMVEGRVETMEEPFWMGGKVVTVFFCVFG